MVLGSGQGVAPNGKWSKDKEIKKVPSNITWCLRAWIWGPVRPGFRSQHFYLLYDLGKVT